MKTFLICDFDRRAKPAPITHVHNCAGAGNDNPTWEGIKIRITNKIKRELAGRSWASSGKTRDACHHLPGFDPPCPGSDFFGKTRDEQIRSVEWQNKDAQVAASAGIGVQRRRNRPGKPSLGEVAPNDWTRPVSFEATVMNHLKGRRRHTKAYRKQAVELLLTGRSLEDLATELHIGKTTLQEWKEWYLTEMANEPLDVQQLTPVQMQEELRQLRKENKKLKLHQEILKKAMGILSDSPPSGMP
jgi:transposase-like protein